MTSDQQSGEVERTSKYAWLRPQNDYDWLYVGGSTLTTVYAAVLGIGNALDGNTLAALVMASFAIVFGGVLAHLYVWAMRRRKRHGVTR